MLKNYPNLTQKNNSKKPSREGFFVIDTPCKLNLSLLVYKPKKNGYHPICSVFQTISLCDTLQIQIIPQGFELHCPNHPQLEQNNILENIFRTLQHRIPFGLRITLTKRIPLGGGLGGGSTNAAGLLLFLNQHAAWYYSQKKLMRLGAAFGADIPFFIQGGTALVRGIGERVVPLPHRHYYYVLLYPNLAVSTRDVYKAFDNTFASQQRAGRTPSGLIRHYFGPNSLQDVVFEMAPAFKMISQKVAALGYPNIAMSGSGATLFLTFKRKHMADRCLKTLKPAFKNYSFFLVHSQR